MTDLKQNQTGIPDRHGRHATYLRLSVTDRCDLRCTYCMSEHMTFLPRKDVLSLEELYRLATVFIDHGVRKIRLTGGEPLVRKNILSLIEGLSRHLEVGELDEIALTTNGTLLDRYAGELAGLGVKRVNVSLDTLNPDRYREITRWGRIERVLAGIDAARDAGLKVKINAVAQKGVFETELDELIRFAHSGGMDLTVIEEMPLGGAMATRATSFLSLDDLKADLARRWTLTPVADSTGGPASYVRIAETGGRLGFIAPMSCNFCADCNRLRLSCTGRLYTCMGHEGSVDLKNALRCSESNVEVAGLIRSAVWTKPACHDFHIGATDGKGIARTMSVLGG